LRISENLSNSMNDRTFYSYTIGKPNEQLTSKQYERYTRLFRDDSFNRPLNPLSKKDFDKVKSRHAHNKKEWNKIDERVKRDNSRYSVSKVINKYSGSFWKMNSKRLRNIQKDKNMTLKQRNFASVVLRTRTKRRR